MRLVALLLLFFALSMSYGVQAQLNSPGTAGSTGLMMGGISTVVTDAASVFANPAGIATTPRTQLLLEAENRFFQNALNSVQAGLVLPTNSGTFGLRINHFGPGEYNEQVIGLVYSRSLSEQLFLGGALQMQQLRIPEYGVRRLLTVSVGLQMELLPQLTLGGYIHNPVRQEITDGEYIPTLFLLGARYTPSEQVQLMLEVEKDIDFEPRVKAGIAYQLGESLILRTGIRTQPVNFSFGMGVPVGEHIRIEVGAWQHQQLGTSPLFHFSYQW